MKARQWKPAVAGTPAGRIGLFGNGAGILFLRICRYVETSFGFRLHGVFTGDGKEHRGKVERQQIRCTGRRNGVSAAGGGGNATGQIHEATS